MLDEWYDFWRVGILLVSGATLFVLGLNWLTRRQDWDEYDRDRWFAMGMWSLAAFEMQIEGILRDTELRYRLVFVTAAALVTLRLLTKNYKRENA